METTFADSEMWGWALLCVPAEILTEKVSRKAVIPRNFLPGKFSDYAVIICLHCRGTICGHSVKGLLRDNMYMYINVHQSFIQSGGGGPGISPPPQKSSNLVWCLVCVIKITLLEILDYSVVPLAMNNNIMCMCIIGEWE